MPGTPVCELDLVSSGGRLQGVWQFHSKELGHCVPGTSR